MNIGQVIIDRNYAISPSDSIRHALDKMADLRLAQLPLVKSDLFLGLVAYESLAGRPKPDNSIQETDITYQQVHIYDTQHVYDAMLFFQIHQLDLLPVIDDQHNYLGAVTPLDLINALSQAMSIPQPGGIIVLEMGNRDNALSHVAHIVEADNAQILNSYVHAFPDSPRLEVTIKINKSDISSIIAAFLRHDYTIKATYNDENSRDNSHDRYEQLMNYINM
ncbi:CBS domain-containing protein [Parapedobacter koreensis]|uniref:CBS domain-containing protein n=1 Tax=Parapedobacter koreensis TaxID=332977 RepID=A0A1H7JNL8_9SPHI|nr:CBS domain-containing protein [Parapedobacter koreensis]SEK76172.1 CBS domain-containing protein [Parapedobacter koreensis]